ncbi:hypothetical protein DPEC_G00169670 [Dallia pectoralis]|uniref:Uncharacterized protein n=1 Tax=Dallia pectoralis TaxID=75939 RepID=A0ACC2GD32_DALPE|nr:hypothetical protein DPEC_G00169670 [Dallia pectoralis]
MSLSGRREKEPASKMSLSVKHDSKAKIPIQLVSMKSYRSLKERLRLKMEYCSTAQRLTMLEEKKHPNLISDTIRLQKLEELKTARILPVPALLLYTLHTLTKKQMKKFQSHLTRPPMSNCPPDTKSQQKTSDRWMDEMVENWGPQDAVIKTMWILIGMNQQDLAVKLKRHYIEGSHLSSSALYDLHRPHHAISVQRSRQQDNLYKHLGLFPVGSSQQPNQQKEIKKEKLSSLLPHEVDKHLSSKRVFSSDQELSSEIIPMEPDSKRARLSSVPDLLMNTLEELTEDQLKTFQCHLIRPQLSDCSPISLCKLEEAVRQLTVDQVLWRYGSERAVEITVNILKKMDQNELSMKLNCALSTSSSYGIKRKETSDEDNNGIQKSKVDLETWFKVKSDRIKIKKKEDVITPHRDTGEKTFISSICGKSFTPEKTEQDLGSHQPESVAVKESFHCLLPDIIEEEEDPAFESPVLLEHPDLKSTDEFIPEVQDQENVREYRFQCPRAGLFQCEVTGLVFGMDGEGEVLYRTVPWDISLLAQSGKRPAGPLFNFTCTQTSISQLHLPHCEVYSKGGCDFLSVAHETDDSIEFIHPHQTTETHVILNVTGFCKYGITKDTNAPVTPIWVMVLLFYQLPDVNNRSILNVLLLPRTVVLDEVCEKRKRRNGDREKYIEINHDCVLTPDEDYTLSTDLSDEHYHIDPKKAMFVNYVSFTNYTTTFQLRLKTVFEEVNLVLKEHHGDETWRRSVPLPAPPVNIPSTGSTTEDTQTAPPLNPPNPLGLAFMRRNRTVLETRLGLLQPILVRLQGCGVLTDEEREVVVSKSTKTLQNQALLDMVVRKGDEAQEEFYQVLRKADPYLVRDLEKNNV